MANRKISELTSAGALTGAEELEVIRPGTNLRTTTQDIADLGSGGAGAVDSVNGQTGVVVLAASNIAVTPTGNIGSTDVQSAIAELDSDIAAGLAGLKWKNPVRVATTVAGTLATSFENGDTVDGVVIATNDRILLKNQADQTTNGIYTVNASGAPTRSTDADAAVELEGAAVSVLEGTSNANTTWLQTTDNITLGASNIVWGQFGSSVPDADGSTKGIAKLYNNVSSNNTDGAPDQNSVNVGLATKQATLTAANFGDFLVALTGKTTPVDADVITLSDSAASDDAKKVTLTNLKAFLKTYFDTLYPAITQATPSTAGATITLDMNSSPQRSHIGSATFSTAKAVAMSNTTGSLFFNFIFEITSVSAALTFPSDWLSSSPDFNGTAWTPPNTGKFEFGGSFDDVNNVWYVKIAGPFI